MSVDFRVNYTDEEDISSLAKRIEISNINGQLKGVFSSSYDIVSEIRTRYSLSYNQKKDKIYRYLNGVKTILVDT